jgi:hypothetical protein
VSIVVANQTQGSTANAATFAVSAPTPSGGDLLLALQATANASGAVTPPSGWTVLDRMSFAGGACDLETYYKVASNSEPASYTFNNGSNLRGSAAIIFDIQNSNSSPNGTTAHGTGTGNTPTSGSLGVAANELVVAAVGIVPAAILIGNDAGWTYDGATVEGGSDVALNFEYQVGPGSPVSGLSWSTSGNPQWGVLLLSVGPAGTGGAGAVPRIVVQRPPLHPAFLE